MFISRAATTILFEFRSLWKLLLFFILCYACFWHLAPYIAGPSLPVKTVSFQSIWLPANLKEINNFQSSFDSGGLWTVKEGLTLPVIRKSLSQYRSKAGDFSEHYFNWLQNRGNLDLYYIAKNTNTTHLIIAKSSLVLPVPPQADSYWQNYSQDKILLKGNTFLINYHSCPSGYYILLLFAFFVVILLFVKYPLDWLLDDFEYWIQKRVREKHNR